jgi:Fur family peroxide stress response transcriptional regulator
MSKQHAELLEQKGIKVSHQRLRILDYLEKNRVHPTADMILNDLKDEMPSLSKSTVYKTLNTFVEKGVLRELTIEENEIRYEYNLQDHGHFKCIECGKVFDFEYRFDVDDIKELKGFRIDDKNIYFKGLCRDCNSSKVM